MWWQSVNKFIAKHSTIIWKWLKVPNVWNQFHCLGDACFRIFENYSVVLVYFMRKTKTLGPRSCFFVFLVWVLPQIKGHDLKNYMIQVIINIPELLIFWLLILGSWISKLERLFLHEVRIKYRALRQDCKLTHEWYCKVILCYFPRAFIEEFRVINQTISGLA